MVVILILIGYYVAAWFCVGIDPKPRTIVPRFEPPEGIAPDEARYLMDQYDDRALTAHMAFLIQEKKVFWIDDWGVSKDVKTSLERLSSIAGAASRPW